jgi:hypothetical protein
MANREIDERFQDWMANPVEGLDWEAKGWLDMDDVESEGCIAKELIALENHGGGFLIIGFAEDSEKRLFSDSNAPSSLKAFGPDAINSIVKSRAEPPFNVDVTFHNSSSGTTHPLMRVAGTTKVPVRSKSATQGKTLRDNIYYVRAPGPESREPKSALEWDALIRRAMLNQRQEIVATIRNFAFESGAIGDNNSASNSSTLETFTEDCLEKWQSLNDSLPATASARISLGYFWFAARAAGANEKAASTDVVDALRGARKYTGWPPFVVLDADPEKRPQLIDRAVQAWVGVDGLTDVGHADFWRASLKGEFFLLRGYQEDARDFPRSALGKSFDISLPIWRLGEFILRAAEASRSCFEAATMLDVRCCWTGLARRQLIDHRDLRYLNDRFAGSNSAVSSGSWAISELDDLLPEIVKSLTGELYETFDFFVPPSELYTTELSRLTGRKY